MIYLENLKIGANSNDSNFQINIVGDGSKTTERDNKFQTTTKSSLFKGDFSEVKLRVFFNI